MNQKPSLIQILKSVQQVLTSDTQGGVKLLVIPGPDGAFSIDAFGAIGDGIADDSTYFQNAVSSNSGLQSSLWLNGTANKEYRFGSTVRIATNGCRIDLRGATIKTDGDICAMEFGSPAETAANTWKGNGVFNGFFVGSGAGMAENRALVVRNHSYGIFSGNQFTNFGAKPILLQSFGRGVQYNDFRDLEITGNYNGAIELDSGSAAGGYINDNRFENIRAYDNPRSGSGGVTHVELTGTEQLQGNRFVASGFETRNSQDTILDIQNGTANCFVHVRLDGDSASVACRLADGCDANWFSLQGQQGSFVDESGTNVLFGDRGSNNFPFMQFGNLEDSHLSGSNAFSLGLKQPGSAKEFHLESMSASGPFRFPGTTPAWFGDRDGGENAPLQINGSQVLLRTLPSSAIGAGPKIKFEGEYSNSGNFGNIDIKQDINGLNVSLGASSDMLHSTGAISVADGIISPSNIAGRAILFVDSLDGNLKVKFSNGIEKTIASNI